MYTTALTAVTYRELYQNHQHWNVVAIELIHKRSSKPTVNNVFHTIATKSQNFAITVNVHNDKFTVTCKTL